MVIIFLMLIFIIIFGIWIFFSFLELAVVTLVNGSLWYVMILRGIYDFKTKRKIGLYAAALGVSAALFLIFGNPLANVYAFDATSIAFVGFVFVQLILYLEKRRSK